MYMVVLEYESDKNRKSMGINASRQEIAERSGLSIKTVNRAVKKMEENGFISRNGRKILISSEQYFKIKSYLDSIVDQSL